MVTAEEIKVNNWFEHNANWCYRSPAEIKPFKFKWEDRDWYALSECTLDLADVFPIPLTQPEILTACGFQMPQKILMLNENDDYWFLFDDAYGFGIQIEKQGESDYICERFKIECKYLHQLQNLIFSLTNKELEINL